MLNNNELFNGYEMMRVVRDSEIDDLPNSIAFDALSTHSVVGVPKASRYVNGRLMQLYSKNENHVGVIAATRLGKTTSVVMNYILSFAEQSNKRSMILFDAKTELYRLTAQTLKDKGYRVVLFNFRDYNHSEYWNPLSPIFRRYREAVSIPDEVTIAETENGKRYRFRGVIYDDEQELDRMVKRIVKMAMNEIANEIDKISALIIPTQNTNDPYWEDSAREVLKAYLWAMLEDSDNKVNPITEHTYSFNTIFEIAATIDTGQHDGSTVDDGGYFASRDKVTSRAYKIIFPILLNNASDTRACIMASFNAKLAVMKDITPRIITGCNSFEMSELVKGPVAVFITYPDELSVYARVISMFIQDAYRYLISYANDQPMGKLDVPFYFICDEFASFGKLQDFEVTISACAGRNIFFVIVLQSYAQLSSVYGENTAAIIRDNLNMHIFMGSNNPETLTKFSDECGKTTRLSPISAMNGTKPTIEHYQFETIPNMPISALSHLAQGDCIVTEANSGYVLYSHFEPYFKCKDFSNLPLSNSGDYKSDINPFDERYIYIPLPSKTPKATKKRNIFDALLDGDL